MPLNTRISAALTRVAAEFGTVYTRLGDLSALTTTDKASLVAAINEVKKGTKEFPTLCSIGDSITRPNSPLITDSGPRTVQRMAWCDIGNLMAGSRFDYLGSHGVDSATIQQIAAGPLQSVLALEPDFCTVLAGHNNYPGGVDTAERAAYAQMCADLMAAGTTPIVVSNLPVSNDPIVFDFNTWLENLATTNGYPFFDAFRVMVEPGTNVYYAGDAPDTVHPGEQGTLRLARGWGRWITEFLPGDDRGAGKRVVGFAGDQRDLGGQGLFLTHSGGLPAGYAAVTAGSATIAPAVDPFGDVRGNRWRGVKTEANTRFQVNSAVFMVSPGTEYRLLARVGADVAAHDAAWRIEVYGIDSADGYELQSAWENHLFSLDENTPLSQRFRTGPDIGRVLLTLTVMGGPSNHSESGGVGASLSIAQLTLEEVV